MNSQDGILIYLFYLIHIVINLLFYNTLIMFGAGPVVSIEESFRDLKSTLFGLSLAFHLTWQVERLQVMLLIASLALMVAWLMGKATELTEQHWQYQANTIRHRKVLSTIFIGLKVIDDLRVSLKASDIVAAWQDLNSIIQSHCEFEPVASRVNSR